MSVRVTDLQGRTAYFPWIKRTSEGVGTLMRNIEAPNSSEPASSEWRSYCW